METFKCFAAMLLALMLLVLVAALDSHFLAFVALWKDAINLVLTGIIALSIIFAARQFYLSDRIRRVESAERLLTSVKKVEDEISDEDSLLRYVKSGDISDLSEAEVDQLKARATRWFDGLTRVYRTAYMYIELDMIRRQEVVSIERSIKSTFGLATYRTYWEDHRKHFESHYKEFYCFMEGQRQSHTE